MINSTAKIIRFEWNLSGHIMRQNMANSSSTKRKDILCLQFYNTIVYLLLFSYCLPCSPMNLMEYKPNNVGIQESDYFKMSGFQKNDNTWDITLQKIYSCLLNYQRFSVHPLSSTLIVSQKIKTWAEPSIIAASQLE